MNVSHCRFKLGELECVSLSDGSWDYPLESFFANVSVEQIEEALPRGRLLTDCITTPYTHLYIHNSLAIAVPGSGRQSR